MTDPTTPERRAELRRLLVDLPLLPWAYDRDTGEVVNASGRVVDLGGDALQAMLAAVNTAPALLDAAESDRRRAVDEALERAALLHDSIDPGCSCQPEGCGAMRAIIQYRDAIRALKEQP